MADDKDRIKVELRLPDQARFFTNIRTNGETRVKHNLPVAKANSHSGKTLALCGAGPSLTDVREVWGETDFMWACNSALPTLWDWGLRPTHAVTMDQNIEMLDPMEWGRALPVHYYLASSVHPELVALLRKRRRSITFYHSFLGIDDPPNWDREARGLYEMWLYQKSKLWPTSIMAGHGLNTVPRAVCLALAMGFEHITIYGADCAMGRFDEPMPVRDDPAYREWLNRIPMYADGRSAGIHGDSPMAEAEFDGRVWHTRPDMAISAKHLLELEELFPGRITLVGDTLPNAIRDKDAEWFDGMPRLSERGVISNFGAQRKTA